MEAPLLNYNRWALISWDCSRPQPLASTLPNPAATCSCNVNRDYGFLPKRAPNLVDGAQLPAKFEPFPADLLGKPIEELDQYVYEKVRKNGNATVVRYDT